MLPRWHIILGAIFTSIIWFFAPTTNPLYLGLIFFASFLIDFDHYLVGLIRKRSWRFKHIFEYHREMKKVEERERANGVYRKGDFHLFHTLEFHIIIGVLGIFFLPFFYIFIGMVFHSLLDLGDSLRKRRFYRREYFLTNWLRKKVAGL